MNLIVCGDALWISCGTWVAFLNGGIGAFVAAVIGGLVALGVVRATSAQQANLAREARSREAAAQLSAAFSAMHLDAHEGLDEVLRLHTVADVAAFRWRMDNFDDAMDDELGEWPPHMYELALELIGESDYPPRSDISSRIATSAAVFGEMAIRWHTVRPRERPRIVQRLREVRDEHRSEHVTD